MKKIICIATFCAGFSFASKAQNSFDISIDKDICVDYILLKLDDNSVTKVSAVCTGEYTYNTGNKKVEAVVIDDVTCYDGTTYFSDGGESRVANFSQVGKHISVSAPGK